MVSKSGITFQIVLLLRRLYCVRYVVEKEIKKVLKRMREKEGVLAVQEIGSNTGRNVNSEVRKSGWNVI